MIITQEIIALVEQIQDSGFLTSSQFKKLICLLEVSCSKSLQGRKLLKKTHLPLNYPVETYAKSFCALTQEKELLEHWYHYGFVVGHQVVSSENCNNAITRIMEILAHFKMQWNNPESWHRDAQGSCIFSRGFFEVYQDDALAQIRQSLMLYLHHVILWGTPYLWTSFDRLGVKLPEGEESKGLPLHVDQNPAVHPDFRTIQGVIALEDCPVERGTFVAVPGSYMDFDNYLNFIKPSYKGEYILLPDNKAKQCISQEIPLKKGDIVSWDSRTTHANSSNLSDKNRYVAYVSAGIAKPGTKWVNERKESFKNGLGVNVRDSYMHASMKPRFTDSLNNIRKPEQLNILGECLYGLREYKDAS